MKMYTDAAADVASGTSLSFASFVREQDKVSVPQKGHVQQPVNDQNASQEFQFSSAIPRRWSSADISNGQLQHQRGKQNHSEAITESSLERPTGTPNNGVKNGTDKKRSTNSGFGQKIFNSFACRDCRAIEPTRTATL